MSAPRWQWGPDRDGEYGYIEVDSDVFSEKDQPVVCVEASHHDATDDHSTLSMLGPAQAREVAAELVKAADAVEKWRARLAASSPTREDNTP